MNIQKHRCRALTLIEILVVIAVGVMVFGLILEIFISTNRAADKEITRTSMAQEAALIAQQIEQVLKGYRVDLTSQRINPEFSSERLTCIAISFQPDSLSRIVTLSNQSQDNRTRIVKEAVSLFESTDKTKEMEILGLKEEVIDTTISFEYATQIQDLSPVWRSEISPMESPLLIRYMITVKDGRNRVKPLLITSTVRVSQ